MRFLSHAALGASVLLLTACGHLAGQGLGAGTSLQPRSGSATSGQANFRQQGDRVLVRVEVSGLTPGQEHGLHIHDKGDCSAPDAMSAGGHFNPTGKPHGPQNADHHGGDLPALKADASGKARAEFSVTGVTVAPGPANAGETDLVRVRLGPSVFSSAPRSGAPNRLRGSPSMSVVRAVTTPWL